MQLRFINILLYITLKKIINKYASVNNTSSIEFLCLKVVMNIIMHS